MVKHGKTAPLSYISDEQKYETKQETRELQNDKDRIDTFDFSKPGKIYGRGRPLPLERTYKGQQKTPAEGPT